MKLIQLRIAEQMSVTVTKRTSFAAMDSDALNRFGEE